MFIYLIKAALKTKTARFCFVLLLLLSVFSSLAARPQDSLSDFKKTLIQAKVSLEEMQAASKVEVELASPSEKGIKQDALNLVNEMVEDVKTLEKKLKNETNLATISQAWSDFQLKQAVRIARTGGVKKYADPDPLIQYKKELKDFPELYSSTFDYQAYLEADYNSQTMTSDQAHASITQRMRLRIEKWLLIQNEQLSSIQAPQQGLSGWLMSLNSIRSIWAYAILLIGIVFVYGCMKEGALALLIRLPKNRVSLYLQQSLALWISYGFICFVAMALPFCYFVIQSGLQSLWNPALMETSLWTSFHSPSNQLADAWMDMVPIRTYLAGQAGDMWFPSFSTTQAMVPSGLVLLVASTLWLMQSLAWTFVLVAMNWQKPSKLFTTLSLISIIPTRLIWIPVMSQISLWWPPLLHLLAGGSGLGVLSYVVIGAVTLILVIILGTLWVRKREINYV